MRTYTPKSKQLKYRLVSTNAKIKNEKLVLVKHGHISIPNYKLGENKEFEKAFSVWVKTHFKFNMIGAYYYKELNELRLPRAVNVNFIFKHFKDRKFKIYNDHIDYDKIPIELKVAPRSDIQLVALSHMICAEPYQDLIKYTGQLIFMDTGEGKSYSTIATAAFNLARTVIICPTVAIAQQWKEYYHAYSNAPKDKVVIISGKSDCNKLLKGKIDAWSYIFVTMTITNFINTEGPIKTERLFNNTKAKIKIIDEVHRNFSTNVMIDCLSNFKMSYYLTATAGRAERAEDFVFNRCFDDIPKSNGLKLLEESHINVFIKKMNFPLNPTMRKYVVVPRIGLNANLYEEILFGYGRKELLGAIDTIMHWVDKSNKDNHKVLFLTSTIDGIRELEKILKEQYPNKKVTTYHSALSKDEKEGYKNGDIIIATDKGSGYGNDISGLRYMINITTYSNKIGARQFKGRLRKIEGKEVFYFEVVNFGYEKTYSQYIKRKPHLAANAKGGKVIEI